MKDVEVIKARNTLSPRARTNFEKRLRVAAYCRVSTDTEDQLNSYKSQVEYYTELIKSKPEWSLAGIYADEAITGTQVKKREDFQRLINDCMNGDVDMVITKSISRFARNTLDTLKYVRMLKDKGVAVFFEEENINTLTMDGELLLVILSSVAQQEVENISANVKKGLKMKMQRGELVGFQGCLGYDYNPEDKTLTVNEEEAAVVRYIFQRYTEGAGGSVIAKELENLGYKTKRGSPKWADSTVIGIIKNEKYKGDILLGKTFTVDPISKRRLYNFGEEDQFYIREHHEPIISEEVFEAAQEILRRRAKPRSLNVDGKREKFSRKYAFSCMIECGFCGGTLTRRSWHSSSQYNKAIWQCVVSTKKGKKFCPESKGVDERTIERAFVESYRLLCQNNKDVLDEFMKRTEEALSESNAGKRLAKAEKDIHALEVKKNKLVDMRLEDTIDKETYDRKYLDLSSQIEQLQKECESLQDAAETETTMRKRVAMFRQTLEQNEVLDTFDRHIFESIVEKVIVGGYDSDGNKDPYMIVFVYKTGFKNSVDGKNFKPLRKNSKENHSPAVLCSHASNEAESMCSDSSDDTRSVLRGKLDLPQTIKVRIQHKPQATCTFDELSEDNLYNQILKTTLQVLLRDENVSTERKVELKKALLFLDTVSALLPSQIPWRQLHYQRSNQNYEMLLNLCYFVLHDMLQTTESGSYKMTAFSDEHMAKLYERFILEYYRQHHPYLTEVMAAQVKWDLVGEHNAAMLRFLPAMQTDIFLRFHEKILILDAKYYSRTLQQRFNKETLHSANLYQIYTYVKNQDTSHTGNVSGLLVYAKTQEAITPDCLFNLGGNLIGARTLDLNQDFRQITAQLDGIAQQFFGKNPQRIGTGSSYPDG